MCPGGAVAISESVRQEAVLAYLLGSGSREQVSKRYGMSVGSLDRFVARYRYAQGLSGTGHGPPLTYTPEELETLRAHMEVSGPMSASQAQQFLAERTGKSVSVSTAEQLLHMLRTRPLGSASKEPPPPQADPAPQPAKPLTKHRYQAPHRRDEPDRYPTDLTDAEWDLLQEHFRPKGGKGSKGGRPPDHSSRRMLDAIFYVLRSGCPWRMLPHDFPPWKSVYTTFRRWMKDGRLQTAHDALRRRLRTELGRNEEPTALIVDSQSVKTTEKGGLAATTLARR